MRMHDFLQLEHCFRCLSRSRRLLLLFAIPSIVGCGNGQASVTGTVTLNGQPVVCNRQLNGTVSFYRESGGGAPAIGIIDESGRYTLKTGGSGGLEPGNYRVGITLRQIIPPANPADMPQGKIITPKYSDVSQSGLTADVKSGSNSFDFALQSQ